MITLALTLFELYSAQKLLNCDIQANDFFFSKVICYGKPSVDFINVLEKCAGTRHCVIIKRQIWKNK